MICGEWRGLAIVESVKLNEHGEAIIIGVIKRLLGTDAGQGEKSSESEGMNSTGKDKMTFDVFNWTVSLYGFFQGGYRVVQDMDRTLPVVAQCFYDFINNQ
jgi:hypothetical protein